MSGSCGSIKEVKNVPKKDKMEKEYEKFEAEIRIIAEEEIKKMGKKIEEVRENAEKIGEEIEGSVKRKKVKSKKSIKP